MLPKVPLALLNRKERLVVAPAPSGSALDVADGKKIEREEKKQSRRENGKERVSKNGATLRRSGNSNSNGNSSSSNTA